MSLEQQDENVTTEPAPPEPKKPTAAEIEDQLEEMQRVNPDDHCSSK